MVMTSKQRSYASVPSSLRDRALGRLAIVLRAEDTLDLQRLREAREA